MLQVRRRFQIADKLCSARAHEIAFHGAAHDRPQEDRLIRIAKEASYAVD
jgi:hypothetical protein